jgi:hypothetical protein
MEPDGNGPANPRLPPAASPITIEYADAVMEGVRAAVVDGLYKLSRNGLEVGGLLLGQVDGATVRILDSRPIACEHAYGPSFQLSPKDEAGLDAQLSSLAAETSSTGLSLVGWYRSGIRAGIRLTEKDRILSDRCCPEPWQVVLVLHPQRLKPTQAAFFLRPTGGWPEEPSPSCVFEVAPVARESKPVPQADVPKPPTPPESSHAPAATSGTEAVAAPPPMTASPRRALFWFLFALAWFIAAASLAFGLREFWLPARTPPLVLQLTEVAGQVLVRWDPSDSLVRQASSGVLEIEDAGRKTTFRLDASQARSGSFTYARASGDVAIQLTLALPHARNLKGASRIAMQSPTRPAIAVVDPVATNGNPARAGTSKSSSKAVKKATSPSRRRPRKRTT